MIYDKLIKIKLMDYQISQQRKKIVHFLIVLSILPFLLFFILDSELSTGLEKAASLSGFVGGVFLIWQFILGIRGFVKNITADYDWAIKIHTFLGIGGGVAVIAHPVLMSSLNNVNFFAFLFLDFSNTYNSYLSYGKISFILFLIIWLTSAVFRKALTYRNWLYIHYLSYPMLFFMLIHPFQIGTLLNSNIFVLYYWYFLVLVSILSILVKVRDILNFSFQKYQVENIDHLPGDIYILTYKVNGNFPKLVPGQYFYIKNRFFSEAHPFSVLDYDEDKKLISFGIKSLGKYTEELKKTKINDSHFIDGPFGEFTVEGQNEDPKVILAGGIGITPFYRLVKDFGNEDTYLLYSNFKLDYALFREKFKNILSKNYFDFISNEKIDGKNIVCDVISTPKIKELVKNYEKNTINFFICGSPGFTNAMIACLYELGISKSKIFIEEFEY